MRSARSVAQPLAFIALGWVLAAMYILGPRVALNRGLDAGYSLASWVGSFG
ncbi:hypothetical protein SH584_06300 [Sphingomonas sp. LY29]|uniref:hypothetical protein n=1 Tax=Sphingomonas sp. LY29 TaxID=3095341 RepID=UPI002D764FA9|nr:hypothetical protein [Sphingomonas sp. LY29]WRP24686.1 hypothetical protein SH584_06300 [Sphingomonas sp. LY29]